ncbi:MAG TPA: hypothetical protein VHM20_05525 [Gammaproteobacteria bacterium]|jgi:hypothetical protein|nr:hypothetical protein [Gammaproteobacteria bacterium]
MPLKDHIPEAAGGAGILGAATGFCALAGVGLYTWISVIWKKMSESDDHELATWGKWLITFIGLGEGYVVAFGLAGAATVGCLCMCLAGACAAASGNDLTQDEMKAMFPDETLKLIKDKAPALAKILKDTSAELKKAEASKETAVVAEETNDQIKKEITKETVIDIQDTPHELKTDKTQKEIIIDSAVEKIYLLYQSAIKTSEEAETFKNNLRNVLTNKLSPQQKDNHDKTHEAVQSNSGYLEFAKSYVNKVHSEARRMLGSFRPAPKAIETIPTVDDDKRNTMSV